MAKYTAISSLINFTLSSAAPWSPLISAVVHLIRIQTLAQISSTRTVATMARLSTRQNTVLIYMIPLNSMKRLSIPSSCMDLRLSLASPLSTGIRAVKKDTTVTLCGR